MTVIVTCKIANAALNKNVVRCRVNVKKDRDLTDVKIVSWQVHCSSR